MSTVDDPRERFEFLQGTMEVLILRSLQIGPNHAYGISQFLERQSGDEFLVDNGSLYPALQRLLQRSWIAAQWKVSPNGRRAQLLPADARGAQTTGGRYLPLAALRRSHGARSGAGGLNMIREWASKLRLLATGRGALADDLSAEIEAHLEFEIQENIARGMSPEDARRAARRHVGNLTGSRSAPSDAWTFRALETFAQDLRYGLRGMRRSPGFALVVVLTLALGIGANTAIFSVVNAVLLRPLPYPAAERLVWLGESDPKAEGISVTWVNYQHWRNENHSFDDMAGSRYRASDPDRPRRSATHARGPGDLRFLRPDGRACGAGPRIRRRGRPAGAAPTAVLDYRFWSGKLGGDPAIVGTTLALDGKAYEVIGVLPPGLQFLPAIHRLLFAAAPDSKAKSWTAAGTGPCVCWPG